YDDLRRSIECLRGEVRQGRLSEQELPVLRIISNKTNDFAQQRERHESAAIVSGRIAASGASVSSSLKDSGFEETLTDSKIYQAYSDAVLRSFPYADIISEVKSLLEEVGMGRLIVFFDDFSELS